MSYTPNVPQANQTIASTTTPIRNNFSFLNTDLQVEHSFNGVPGGGVAEGVHLRTSMPNQADPGSLPAGTSGQYYVRLARPRFYDGTTAWQLQITNLFQLATSGTVALTNTSDTVFFTAPASSAGAYYLVPTTTGAQNASAMGQFVSGTADVQVATNSDPNISITTSGLTIRARVATSGLNGNYKLAVIYYTP